MGRNRETDDRIALGEQPTYEAYAPAMAPVSSEPGRIERVLTRLFRRRGQTGADRIRAESNDAKESSASTTEAVSE